MTPLETQMAINATVKVRERELKDMRAHAWMTAYLGRVKKMPEFEKFLNPPKPRTPEQIEEDKQFHLKMAERVAKQRKKDDS